MFEIKNNVLDVRRKNPNRALSRMGDDDCKTKTKDEDVRSDEKAGSGSEIFQSARDCHEGKGHLNLQ